MHWYINETAKKLLNPDHIIEPQVSALSDNKLSDLKIVLEAPSSKLVNRDKIQDFKLIPSETIPKQIADYLQSILDSGDRYLQLGDNENAIRTFNKLLIKIKEKSTSERQRSLEPMINIIGERIKTSYSRKFLPLIKKLDEKIYNMGDPTVKDSLLLHDKYSDLVKEIEIQPEYIQQNLNELLKLTKSRAANMELVLAGIYNQRAVREHENYQFASALKSFKKALEWGTVSLKNQESDNTKLFVKNIKDSIKLTQSTGESYVTNKMLSMTDRAEFYIIRGQDGKAKSSIEEARNLMICNWEFITQTALERYNRVNKVVNRGTDESLTMKTPPSVFFSTDALWRSVLIPGWGQYAFNKKNRAILFAGSFYGLLAAAIIFKISSKKDFQAYSDINTKNQSKLNSTYNSANTKNKISITLFILTGIIYAVNVLDAYFLGNDRGGFCAFCGVIPSVSGIKESGVIKESGSMRASEISKNDFPTHSSINQIKFALGMRF
jgi:hypothetical protein